MTFHPRIFSFYSYKGGVGRSMALLNTAYYLQARGRHVLIVDLDLEAPGASGFLHRSKELLTRESKGDVVDVLQKVVDVVKKTPDGEAPQLPALDLKDYLRSVRPDKYATAAHPKAPRARLDVLGAEQGLDYTARYSALELPNLSADQVADTSDLLRGLLIQHSFPFHQPWQEEEAAPQPTHYDYILVDSRTGLSEIGGLCVGPLSDRLVVLCGLNDQNIMGTRHFMEVVGLDPQTRPANAKAWDDADPSGEDGPRPDTLGPKPTLLVASPVPGGEMTYKKERMQEMQRQLGMTPVKLSYHPHMALMETIFVRDHEDEYLALEYATLAQRVMSLVGDTEQHLKAAIQSMVARSRSNKEDQPDTLALKQLLARSALAGNQPDFGVVSHQMSRLGLSSEAQDEIRRLQINLAPTDDLAAELWLEWADALDTEEARQAGNLAVLQSMQEKYQKATTMRPDFSQAYYHWGVALSAWAQTQQREAAGTLFTQASEKYKQATDLNPYHGYAFYNWGTALSKWAKTQSREAAEILFAHALEKYQQATALKPDLADAFNNWGNALSDWAKIQSSTGAEALLAQAFEKYQQATTLNPDHAVAFHNWGIALMQLAHTQPRTAAETLIAQACEKFQNVTDLEHDHADAFSNWGAALSELAKTQPPEEAETLFAQACEKFHQATALKPDHASAFNNWSIALMRWAQTQEASEAETLLAQAEEKLQRTLEIEPDNFNVLFNLGCLAALRGEVEACVAALERWKAANPKANKAKLDEDKDFDRVRDDPRFKALRDGLAN